MSLSEYENAQFQTLTADFTIDDPSVLKKMGKRDKATAMSFVALPSLSLMLLVAEGIALLFTLAGRLTDNMNQMYISGAIGLLLILASTILCPQPVKVSTEQEQSE
jgi:hypothetical protein